LGASSSVSPHYEGGTPGEFGQYVESMVDWMDANPNKITKDRLAVICAWNEWVEGSYLLPDMLNGYGYLQAVRKVMGGKYSR